MTSINQVVLAGTVKAKPTFGDTRGGKRWARLKLVTTKFVRIGDETRQIDTVHDVVCYNQYSIPALEKGKDTLAGSLVKVVGELTRNSNDAVEITVSPFNGEVGILAPSAAWASGQGQVAGSGSGTSTAPSARPAAVTSRTPPRAGGGMQRLDQLETGGDRDDRPPEEPFSPRTDDGRAGTTGRPTSAANFGGDEDDSIPF